jgi:hypothetical protein
VPREPVIDIGLEYFMRGLAARNDWMAYRTTDFQSEEGRAFPYVYLSESNQESVSAINGTEKVKVFLQGAVHG